MNNGFKSLQIEPTEDYLDFIGPAKSSSLKTTDAAAGEPPPQEARVLKGHVKFTLLKPTKIRSISVKFKGFSQIILQQPSQLEISTPLLPKLKIPIGVSKATLLPAGDHVLPWELDIPNIYPRTLLIKRASINYKVIVTISMGLTARAISAESAIIIRRHLLPYKELAPIIETKLFQKTVPGKFHYEIDAPQIVCKQQNFIPMAIKYISIANQKPVKTIRTRIIQIELYRRQSVSKSESNLTICNKDAQIFDLDQKMVDFSQYKDTYIKYIKRANPAFVHIPDPSTSAWKRPCLIRHRLHPNLAYTLGSPLVSIYHIIEITFQFGAKYEEIKAEIPIIIASIPKRQDITLAQQAAVSPTIGSSSTAINPGDMMMKYAFEEVARSEFLSYREEPQGDSATHPDDELLIENDDNTFNVVRDTAVMSPASEVYGSQGQITGRVVTAMMYGTTGHNGGLQPPPPQQQSIPSAFSNYNHSKSCDTFGHPRRALSPPLPDINNKHLLGLPASYQQRPSDDHRQLKKFASAFDLSTASEESSSMMMNDVEDRFSDERPRTTTPTMKRQMAPRKVLSPINVDLANRKDRRPLPPPSMDLPPIPAQQAPLSESESSDVLPPMDRLTLSKSNTSTAQQQQDKRSNWQQQHEEDDIRSVYSDTSYTSATNAPSLSSSATLSTNKSYPTLHSRPPSPVFAPAPGLPATTALRSHSMAQQQIEEMFPSPESVGVSSPAMNTVASSTLLSPRTTYALRRRIALSTISSLTNDSSLPGQTSSRNDSDMQSWMRMSDYSMSFYQLPPPSANHYLNAQLPPIPGDVVVPPPRERSSRRLTKIYVDDSDDDEDKESISSIPSIPQLPYQASSTTSGSSGGAPPKLPRLSFGGDFGSISLGI